MARTRLGFDMGSSSLKVAVLHGESLRVEQVGLPEELRDENGALRTQDVPPFLRQVRRKLRLPMAPAALVLPRSQTVCRLVAMPPMPAAQIQASLPGEFAGVLQGGPDQYQWGCWACTATAEEREKGRLPVIAAAMARQKLEAYGEMFARAGVRIREFLPQELSILRLTAGRGEEALCFVDLGHRRTRVTVVCGDRLRVTKRITLGGRHLDRVVADELGVDAGTADDYKRSNHQNILSAPSVQALCERIAAEILKSVSYYHRAYRPGRLRGVYLTGGGASLPPLRYAIAAATGLELLDPGTLLPGAGEMAAAALFAVGAALPGLG